MRELLGQRIRRLRRERGWSQRELARRAGVSNSLISRIELGQGEELSLAHLERIARVLGVSLSYLVSTDEFAPADDPEVQELLREFLTLPADVRKSIEYAIRWAVQRQRQQRIEEDHTQQKQIAESQTGYTA